MEILSVDKAVERIRAAQVVAYPTETFYGLAVDALNSEALRLLDAVKQRPSEKSYPVLIPSVAYLSSVVALSPAVTALIEAFWPGPLTLVLPALQALPFASNDGTIGVRMSRHAMAQQLVQALNGPITSTSANLSDTPAASEPMAVAKMFPNIGIVDAGKTPGGLPSTVIKIVEGELQLLRAGAIDFGKISEVYNRGY